MGLAKVFRERLGVRLTTMFLAAALIPLLVVGLLSYQRASSSLRDLALVNVEQEAQLITRDLNTFLGQFSADLLALTSTPPVQGIIRARDNDGVDPKSNDLYEVWVNRLTQIFKANAQEKKIYQQLRYINELGDEMVRVDFKNGVVDLVSGTDRLQNKGSASYFTEASNLLNGEIATSPLNLNKENGQIQVPHVPVIRFSTPVRDPEGRFRGVVVSNVYANRFWAGLPQNPARFTSPMRMAPTY